MLLTKIKKRKQKQEHGVIHLEFIISLRMAILMIWSMQKMGILKSLLAKGSSTSLLSLVWIWTV